LSKSGIHAALIILGGAITGAATGIAAPAPPPPWIASSMGLLQTELTARYGLGQRLRIQRGLAQAARFWQAGDGGADMFEAFVRDQFAGTQAALDALFVRLEEIPPGPPDRLPGFPAGAPGAGPGLPVEPLLAPLDPDTAASLRAQEGFRSKLGFAILLNFPLTTLEERSVRGEAWNGRQWAEAWLAAPYLRRAPVPVERGGAWAAAAAGLRLAGWRVSPGRLLDGRRGPFPAGAPALAAADLPAAIRAGYRAGRAGLRRQRTLQKVLERLAEDAAPSGVGSAEGPGWDPSRPPAAGGTAPETEDDRPGWRSRALLGVFRAERQLDPYSPAAPTRLDRSFREERQLPETRVRALLEAVCGSPQVARAARVIRRRLGRPLEPFDLWYDGFRRGPEPDGLVRRRWPDPAGYRADRPELLAGLGFPADQGTWLLAGCDGRPAPVLSGVPPGARGPEGRDWLAALKGDGLWLANRLAARSAGSPLLAGVPGPACATALARVFRARTLARLDPAGTGERALEALWSTFRSAGTALVDLAVWHWLYDHPEAGADQLRQAVPALAREVWNRHYASLLGQRDATLLAAAPRLVDGRLGLADPPLGRIIAAQVEARLDRPGAEAAELTRMAGLGRRGTDLWVQLATGAPLGPEALLAAAEKGLQQAGGGT
jgi:hypothetical protein